MTEPLSISVLAEAMCNDAACRIIAEQEDAPDFEDSRAHVRGYWTELARATIHFIEAHGYKIVPVECTQEMADAMYEAHAKSACVFANEDEVWSAMITSSPKVE